jgi:acetate kinase
MDDNKNLVLVINTGSSSLKIALYNASDLSEIKKLSIDNIGQESSSSNHTEAIASALDQLSQISDLSKLLAIGYRVVTAGPDIKSSQIIDSEFLGKLRAYETYDPDHIPYLLEVIEYVSTKLPDIKQLACLDSQFFVSLPTNAKILPIPRKYTNEGLVKNGYHGLSYAYLLSKIENAENKKIIFAHLGSGASMCAVKNGQPIDTTMSYSPSSGIPMSTRSGDLDPQIVLYFMRRGLDPDQIDNLINHESGLKGISQISGDMAELLSLESTDQNARDAVNKFVYEIKKVIGAYSAIMGGVDQLVFSGGIGARSAEIRRRICEGLEFLNIELDQEKNQSNQTAIALSGKIEVTVMQTDEEIVIAHEIIKN